MAHLVFAPYLPLSERATVGSWTLIPFSAARTSDVVPDDLRRATCRLIDAYEVDDDIGTLGAVVEPSTGVGSEVERGALGLLGKGLLAGILNGNPRLLDAEDESPNAGWAMATAENAIVFGHPLGDGDSYVIETGTLARVTSMRHGSPDEPLPKITPPNELRVPTLGWSFDDEFADATFGILQRPDRSGRRLGRALDWYRIVFSNAEAITPDLRVEGARSAAEILTGSGDETRRLVRAYGRLMRDEDSEEVTYDEAFWANGPVQLTNDEWWMTRLCRLRNAIIHSELVADDLWEHEDQHHVNHIHDRLLEALRRFISEAAGDPLLRLGTFDRVLHRAYRDLTD